MTSSTPCRSPQLDLEAVILAKDHVAEGSLARPTTVGRNPILNPIVNPNVATLLGIGFFLLGAGILVAPANADDPGEPAPVVTPYADAVVTKAEAVLADAGLRRSGKSIVSSTVTDIARELTVIAKSRRELAMQQKDFSELANKVAQVNEQIRLSDVADGDLNLQLARVAGNDVAANNRIVALINANRTRINQLRTQRVQIQEFVNDARSQLNGKEAEYAETVFQLRQELDALRDEVAMNLTDAKVKIALQVMHANHGVPIGTTAADVLQTVESRLAKIEQEVFSESIALEVERNGSLYVTASINNQPVRMVVDSGATLVTLPAEEARRLNITVPPDAPRLRLALANGEEIAAHRVDLASIRVGQFEAKTISCAVLDDDAVRAEPMLGMSYLGEFKFEIDASEKSLSMLRVETDQK